MPPSSSLNFFFIDSLRKQLFCDFSRLFVFWGLFIKQLSGPNTSYCCPYLYDCTCYSSASSPHTPPPIFISVVHSFIVFLACFIILPIPHFPTPNILFFPSLVGMMDPTYSYEEHLFDFALFHKRLCIHTSPNRASAIWGQSLISGIFYFPSPSF